MEEKKEKRKGKVRDINAVWKLLEEHYKEMKKTTLCELFSLDPQRGKKMSIEDVGIYFDYSKHIVTEETLNLLLLLAEKSDLQNNIEAMFQGQKINFTENRPALHTALRTPKEESILVEGENIIKKVQRELSKMENFARLIQSGEKRGYTGKPIKNIVNIGIGGSSLGPEMAYQALRFYSTPDIHFYFLSNIDSTDFYQNVSLLNPEETLFIISSKTFTTIETMTNSLTARNWLLTHLKDEQAIKKHFVAVSTNSAKVEEFGITSENTFLFWDWVGGRYSLCSTIGLSLMLSIGPENFSALLNGFREIDRHFRYTPLERNIPVLMALLGIWYNNFFGAETVAILPYEEYLKLFPTYIQQLAMESNGKSVSREGEKTSYKTSPIYWGEVGTKGQHSFYQLIHQGTRLIPCDFIAFFQPLHEIGNHHQLLISNLFAQAEALAFGKDKEKLEEEGIKKELIPYLIHEGNRPSSMILMKKLTPENFGKLIALYEHIVFTQAIIWDINPFDQWGVELGKVLASRIAKEMENPYQVKLSHDSSTNHLIKKYWDVNNKRKK